MDPARTDKLYEWLSYVHPLLAALTLILALVVLNAGLFMRDVRLRRKTARPAVTARHVRLAPYVAWLIGIVFVLGPLSSWFVRKWVPLQTFHGWIGTLTAALFISAALLGRKLKIQPGPRVSLHGKLGLLAMFLSMLVALTGFNLLP